MDEAGCASYAHSIYTSCGHKPCEIRWIHELSFHTTSRRPRNYELLISSGRRVGAYLNCLLLIECEWQRLLVAPWTLIFCFRLNVSGDVFP